MPYDLVIAGGTVVTGLPGEPREADVAVQGDAIAAVGPGLAAGARRTLPAAGCLVCPGFVDMHSHSDLDLLCGRGAEVKLLQGVTTDVIGNCGFSFYPARAAHAEEAFGFLSLLFDDAAPEHLCADAGAYFARVGVPGTNVVSLVGHNMLRLHANGCGKALAPGALEEMQHLLAQQLTAGSGGLSTGLLYAPACFADTGELTALARVVHRHGRLLSCHLRDEGDHLADSVAEMLAVQEATGVALQISHLKASGRRNWGTLAGVLDRLSEAAARGADVRFDAYPFVFGCTTIVTLLPAAVLDAEPEILRRRLADPSVRALVRQELARPESLFAAVGPDRIVVAGSVSPEVCRHAGRSLGQIAREQGRDPVETLLDLVTADRGRTSIFLFQMDESDMRRALAHPLGVLGSDGIPVSHGVAHPRLRSAFLEMLCRYAAGEGLLPLPAAVRKMSALPAQRLGLERRGTLAPGQAADVVVVDPARVRTAADPFRPQPFRGVETVVLNGQVVVEGAEYTGLRAGRILRR